MSQPHPLTPAAGNVVFTVGHSTLPIQEFLALLQAHGVNFLVDVRTIPKSRYNPQFNADSLATSLQAEEIGYLHMPELGGLRHPKKNSINFGWRNLSFRGYADYMQTAEFTQAIEKLIALSQAKQVVIMCAEAVHWRCHRSLVADALSVRGIPVEHISQRSRRLAHKLTSFARVSGQMISYPEESLWDGVEEKPSP